MDINKKIDEIRKQPQHIRIRYVWGSVGVCMLFIFTIWIFSFQENLKDPVFQEKIQNSAELEELSRQAEQFQDELDTLETTTTDARRVVEDGPPELRPTEPEEDNTQTNESESNENAETTSSEAEDLE